MAASHIAIDVADAVTDSINAATFTPAVTAVRTYSPERDLEDLIDLAVFVMPGSMIVEKETRAENSYMIRIDVVIAKKITSDANATIDAFMDLAQEIIEHFDRLKLTAGTNTAHWQSAENDPLFDGPRLENGRVFVATVSLMYLVVT